IRAIRPLRRRARPPSAFFGEGGRVRTAAGEKNPRARAGLSIEVRMAISFGLAIDGQGRIAADRRNGLDSLRRRVGVPTRCRDAPYRLTSPALVSSAEAARPASSWWPFWPGLGAATPDTASEIRRGTATRTQTASAPRISPAFRAIARIGSLLAAR